MNSKIKFLLKFFIFSILIFNGTPLLQAQNLTELQNLKNQLELQFWKLKEKNLKSRQQVKNQLTLLDENIKNLNERRNSLVEEFYLIQENKTQIEENLAESINQKSSFFNLIEEEIINEKDNLKSYFPIFIERNTPILNNLDRIEKNSLEKVEALIEYKNNLIQESEKFEIYNQPFINPDSNESISVQVVRLGFIASLFSNPEYDLVGFLLRTSNLGGISYEWVTEIPNQKKSLIASSVASIINNLDEDVLVEVAVDPVQAGDKLRSFLSNKDQNIFQAIINFVRSGGIIMYPLILLGLVSIFIIVDRLIFFNRYNFKKNPDFLNFLNSFGEKFKLNQMNFNLKKQAPLGDFIRDIFKLVDESKKNNSSKNEVEKKIEEKIYNLETLLNSKLTTLAVLGSIAPLLGLLGTVSGMIALFEVITVYGTSNPKILADGISIALITTQTGLALAIPILLFHHFLLRRKIRIISFLEQKSIKILEIPEEKNKIKDEEGEKEQIKDYPTPDITFSSSHQT